MSNLFFHPHATYDLDSIQWPTYAYLDKAQETKRLSELAKKPDAADIEKRKADREKRKKVNQAWSNKVTRQEEKEKRQQKKSLKRKWLNANAEKAQSTQENGSKDEDRDDEDDGDDWAELAKEERMAKKVKKGNISQADFDAEFAMDL
jgi:ATP-dependent RNA helicase DDX55/SPB4